jgi:hypothetical protein
MIQPRLVKKLQAECCYRFQLKYIMCFFASFLPPKQIGLLEPRSKIWKCIKFAVMLNSKYPPAINLGKPWYANAPLHQTVRFILHPREPEVALYLVVSTYSTELWCLVWYKSNSGCVGIWRLMAAGYLEFQIRNLAPSRLYSSAVKFEVLARRQSSNGR